MSPHQIPGRAICHIDVNEEGHGATFLDKLGRDVSWDSRFEARLHRILNGSRMVATFQQQPVCVPYQCDGRSRCYYPDVVVQLRDGRAVLVEVKPIYQVAYAVNQDKFDAGRVYAHSREWGWLVWTDRDSIPELMRREVDPGLGERVTAAVMAGDADWTAIRSFNAQGLQFLDLIALTIANRWRWERGPVRLAVRRERPQTEALRPRATNSRWAVWAEFGWRRRQAAARLDDPPAAGHQRPLKGKRNGGGGRDVGGERENSAYECNVEWAGGGGRLSPTGFGWAVGVRSQQLRRQLLPQRVWFAQAAMTGLQLMRLGRTRMSLLSPA